MARSARNGSDRDRAGRLRQQFGLWWERAFPGVVGVVRIVVGVGLIAAVGLWLDRLEDRYHARQAWPTAVSFELPGAPEHVAAALRSELRDFQESGWLGPELCPQVHARIVDNAWIRTIRQVAKEAPGVVVVDCEYREPVALAQPPGAEYYCLIDESGVRLPGTYRFEADWVALTGLTAPAPDPGETWTGADISAGLELVGLFARAPFVEQIHAIDLHNLDGRREPLASHVVLRTDRGSTILWGSAPGREFGENTLDEKMTILAANYQQHERIDGAHDIIDISVYPDRYIVRR